MDTQPILSLILEEARQAAQKAEAAAGERALSIEKDSQEKAAAAKERALSDAAAEAAASRERARRLRELEDRKYALAARRKLMDEAFDKALISLRALPDAEMERLMLDLVAQNASGDERLLAGDINGGFYTPAFIEKANRSLEASGKKGGLKDAGSRAKGCCGLVLQSASSSTYCTVDALVEAGREGLEQKVAALLFEDQAL